MKINAPALGTISFVMFLIFCVPVVVYVFILEDRSHDKYIEKQKNSYIHLCLKYNSGYTKEDCEARYNLNYSVVEKN